MTDTDRWAREFDEVHAQAQADYAKRNGAAPANGTTGAEFLARLFGPVSTAPVFLSSLANAEDKATEPGERRLFSRNPDEIEAFARKWDRPKRGLYFCVATMRSDGGRRAKEFAAEIVLLHADVDCKDIDLPADEVLQKFEQLRLLPTWIVATGHGYHLYWTLREAIAATPEAIERVEACLRLLCEHVAGDRACNEVSRLMRLPASHNSKLGEWAPVEIVSERAHARYELEELEEWLAETAPLLRRQAEEPAADNPWLAIANNCGFKPPVDVEQRLAAMRYGGAGEVAIHPTQVSVTAALLNRGQAIEDVIAMVLAATRVAAGEHGERWNWTREERAVRRMCSSWLAKHPDVSAAASEAAEGEAEAETETTAQATGTDGKVIPLKRKPRPTKPPGKHEIPLAIADGVIEIVRASGGDLLLADGDLHVYSAGVWRIADGAVEQWLRVLIQQGCQQLGEGAKLGVVNAAWKRLNEHPDLHRRDVGWDRHGLVAVGNGVLDLRTRQFSTWSPAHFLRRKLAVGYEAGAACPRFLEFLGGLFADREEKTRTQVIALLQEAFGACMGTPLLNREQRRALLFRGPSRTSKTDLAKIIGLLVGDPIAAPAMREIDERFGMEPFVGACAWIRDDAVNEGDRINPERFKTIVTGEPVDIARKNRKALRRVRLDIPVVLTANSLPTSRDSSDAIFNRSLVIELSNVFSEEAAAAARTAHGVADGQTLGGWVFEQEGPGILNWALTGLARLLKRGCYEIPAAVRAAIQAFRDDSNPVAEWARTMLAPAEHTKIERADLLCAFHGWWREEMGDDIRLLGGRWLVPKLRAACPHAIPTKIKGFRYFGGIKLTDGGLKYWSQQSADAAQRGRGSAGSSTTAKDVNRVWDRQKDDAE